MADWTKIKKEYITSDISLRDLAQKHGVPNATIFKRCKKEGWTELRAQTERRTVAKAAEKAEDAKNLLYELAVKMARSLSEVADRSTVELAEAGLKPRDITLAAKDVQDLLHIRSDIDVREQEARIANLRKMAEKADQEDREIVVSISGDLEKYAK